jgi:chromosome partitioning protein
MNQKGGVGKTTTVSNLGAALADMGRRVLLVDMDPQANLTRGVGLTHEDVAAGKSTYDVLTDHGIGLAQAVRRTAWPRLDIAPSHIDLSGAELEMVQMYGRELRLRKSLGELTDRYDYILIDCLPSLSLITVNAVTAAREVFVPMQAHPFALEGLGKLFEVLDLVRNELNPELELTGVVVNMYDPRTKVAQTVMEQLLAHPRLQGRIFRTIIRQNIKIAESQGAGQPVVHFDRHSHGAVAYRVLAEEVDAMRRAAVQPSGQARPAAVPAPPPAAPTGAVDVTVEVVPLTAPPRGGQAAPAASQSPPPVQPPA